MSELLDDLAAAMAHPEDLDPELHESLTDSVLGPVIKHQLLFAVPYIPAMNPLINKSFQAKKAAAASALAGRDWAQYLWLHERPYRVFAFARIAAQMSDTDYWARLAQVWTDSENIFEAEQLWLRLLRDPARLPSRRLLMDEDERTHLAGLPDQIAVYRGYSHPDRRGGMSWSLDRKVAVRFASRFGTSGKVACRRVPKSAVIAYFAGRGEQEIVLAPKAAARRQEAAA
jgi:hypothetical protein